MVGGGFRRTEIRPDGVTVNFGAGSETALNKHLKQVVIASAITPMDVNDISSRLETTYNDPDSC